MSTSRARHPHKEIERAVRYAEQRGWTVLMSSGHRWATILCTRRARDGCRHPVYSTPRNPEQHARRLVRLIDKCQHG
jgi:hypothetical protein